MPTVTFVVDSIVDAVDANPGDGACDDGGGNCTLRAAIMEANAVAGVAAITLPSGTYTIAIGRPADVSELHPGEDAAVTGDLDIADDLIIEGAGSDTTIVDGGALDRVFHVLVGSTVEISGLTVRNGDPAVYGLRNAAKSGGGGIANGGTLTLTEVIVSGNTVRGGNGGGISTRGGELTLTEVIVSGNTVRGGNGDGISTRGGELTLTEVIVSDNRADWGGGIYNVPGSTLTLTNVALRTNTAAFSGGGILNEGGSR